MNFGERWFRRPQGVFLRKALFQVHLWTGIAVGIYVFLISVSGSAIVFRNEIFQAFERKHTVTISGPKLSGSDLKQAARQDFPKYSLEFVAQSPDPKQPAEVWLDRDGKTSAHYLNPYTGEDLGDVAPLPIRILGSLVDFHTNLWYGRTGRRWNGVGAILTTILALTGAVIWWPGVEQWRGSVKIDWKANWKRLNWNLHSVVGIWTLAFAIIWGVTGIYVVFPKPFQQAVNVFAPLRVYKLDDGLTAAQAAAGRTQRVFNVRRAPIPPSKGDQVLRWFYYLHFGNFAGTGVKVIWVLFGLAPPFLFVTGTIMWWNRVLRNALKRPVVVDLRPHEAPGTD